MINKIKVIVMSSVLALFSTGTYAAPSFDSMAVGLTGSWGVYKADGTENTNGSKQSEEGELEVAFGSVFFEVDTGQITLGLDYIPMESDSNEVSGIRQENEHPMPSPSAKTNKASVTIQDHVTIYALAPLGDLGIYAKLGFSQMKVKTNEVLATGGAYDDISDAQGYHFGLGYETDVDSDFFVRAGITYHDYDTISATNKNNTDIKVTADLDGTTADISIGRRF